MRIILLGVLFCGLGCTTPLLGHQYTGADLSLDYHRVSGLEGSMSAVIEGYRQEVQLRQSFRESRNVYGGGVVMHFRYVPPCPRTNCGGPRVPIVDAASYPKTE